MSNKVAEPQSPEVIEEKLEEKFKDQFTVSFGQEIEDRVFQSIALQCLAKIEGVSLVEGNIIDHLFGRTSTERIRGIHVSQDGKTGALKVKVEVNMNYGISIPEKAKEIQHKIAEEMKMLTGLDVSGVHVVFKNLILPALEGAAKKSALVESDLPLSGEKHVGETASTS